MTNLNNDPEFAEQIINLGKRFCQDSVIIVPKGEEGYLYGTNKGKYPGLDKRKQLASLWAGKQANFMSRINSRPFVMKEGEETKTYEQLPAKQRQAAKLIAKRVGEQINDMHVFFEADLQAYDNGGTTTLYHYAPVDEDEIEVDPSQFGKQRYSRREKQRSTYPRSFFMSTLTKQKVKLNLGKIFIRLNFLQKSCIVFLTILMG